jgi:hypothetical protein
MAFGRSKSQRRQPQGESYRYPLEVQTSTSNSVAYGYLAFSAPLFGTSSFCYVAR